MFIEKISFTSRNIDEVCLSDDDEVGGSSQIFEVPPTPRKPKTQIKRRYNSEEQQQECASTSFQIKPDVQTPKRVKHVKTRAQNETFINLADKADTPDYDKITLFLGKSIYMENTIFKGVPYICLFRKEDDTIKNRFNIPLELTEVLKRAINIISEKNEGV